MTDDELCKAMGIEPDYWECTKYLQRRDCKTPDGCDDCRYKRGGRYPTGDALTKALKEKLREKGCSYLGGWDAFHQCYCITFLETPEKCEPVITEENWEITKADTELDAIKAACKAMCEVKKQ